MTHDFCVLLAPRFSEKKCSFQNEAKIITFSAGCRYENVALEDKIAEVFEIENLRSETNCKTEWRRERTYFGLGKVLVCRIFATTHYS